jgi:hypothetical protein
MPTRTRPDSPPADFEWPVPDSALEEFEIVPLENCPRSLDDLTTSLRADTAVDVPSASVDAAAAPSDEQWSVPLAPPVRTDGRDAHRWRAGLALAAGLGCVAAAYVSAPVWLRSPNLTHEAAAPPTVPPVASNGDAPALAAASTQNEPPARRTERAPRIVERKSRPLPAAAEPRPRARSAANRGTGPTAPETRPRAASPAADAAVKPGDRARAAVAERTVVPAVVSNDAPPPAPVESVLDAPARNPTTTPTPPPAAVAEQERITSTLTRFRRAYSQLDVDAARAVWPGVDARALGRAFKGLKSQEIQFDRCDLVVRDGEASAACRGRSTYVPRIGSQSPRTDERQWTFQLRKVDQQWTIQTAAFR